MRWEGPGNLGTANSLAWKFVQAGRVELTSLDGGTDGRALRQNSVYDACSLHRVQEILLLQLTIKYIQNEIFVATLISKSRTVMVVELSEACTVAFEA